MKRQIAILALIMVTMLLLTACGQPKKVDGLQVADPNSQVIFPPDIADTGNVPAQNQPATNDGATDPTEVDWNDPPYDPASEEIGDDVDTPENYVEATIYPFAGATPMPLDPIDMPSATPHPKLTFTYQPYDVTRLGITFEGPVGWVVDETTESTIILWQPEHEVVENYRAYLSIEVKSVGSSLSGSEMKNQVKSTIDNISAKNYQTFSSTNTAPRTLFGEDGVYANYRGVLMDGTIVRGRVHVCSVNKKTVVVHLSCPGEYNEDYMDGVYVRMRNTMKMVN